MQATAPARPFRRATSTPVARLTEIAQLLSFVSGLRCDRHECRASVQEVIDGRVTYGACCEEMLDIVERELENVERRVRSLRV